MTKQGEWLELVRALNRLPPKTQRELFSSFTKYPELIPLAADLLAKKNAAMQSGKPTEFAKIIKEENDRVNQIIAGIEKS